MARDIYKGFDLPDGAEVPNVPGDLHTLVDGVPRGYLNGANNSVMHDVTDAHETLATLTFTLAYERRVLLAAYVQGSIITGTASIVNCYVSGLAAIDPMYLFYSENVPDGLARVGSVSYGGLFPAGANTVLLRAVCSGAGAFRVQPGNARVQAWEIGPSA